MGQYWLLKTEAEEWSWQDQATNGGISQWDGVRNAQAQNNMKQMRNGDLCLFYHSGKEKRIIGAVKVIKEMYPDPSDTSSKYGAVDVEAVCPLQTPVTLAQMKNDPAFADFAMLKQPRLSVVPVQESVWRRVCELGGVSF